jgi:hypothetical protein
MFGLKHLIAGNSNKSRPTLWEIFFKHARPDIDKWQHYIQKYSELFSGLPANVTLLEIGVYHGGSLRLWSEYFGPTSTIIGIDNNPDCKKYESGNIKVAIGDQGDPQFLSQLSSRFGGFDIVIDDGSHRVSDQISSFDALISSTRRMYIIEDTHAAYWEPDQKKDLLSGLVTRHMDILHGWFVAAGSPELFDDNAWSDRHQDDIPQMRHRLVSVELLDSMIIFHLGNNYPPKRLRVRASPSP